jgi:hypothetical protein
MKMLGSTFRDLTAFVQQDCFVESAAMRLVRGEHTVHIRSADFVASGDSVILDPAPRAHAGVKTFFYVQVFPERQSDNGERILIVRSNADPFRGFVCDGADVCVGAQLVSV